LETVLCKICQLTGVLCASCERKLKKGEISQLDVDISVFLGQRTKDKKEAEGIKFLNALYIDDYIILFFQKGDLRKFLKAGREIIDEMRKKFRAKIMLVEHHHNLREFIEGLFYPVPVTAINVIWLPDGSMETRIILGRRISKKKADIVNKITKKVKNVEVKVEYLNK
jgi:transcription antitermination factor NusA-like protein